MSAGALLDERVAQHADQSRADGQSEPELNALFYKMMPAQEKRDVGLDESLHQPIVATRTGILAVIHERKVRMKKKAQVTKRHERLSLLSVFPARRRRPGADFPFYASSGPRQRE
jgi:hypothetical protein